MLDEYNFEKTVTNMLGWNTKYSTRNPNFANKTEINTETSCLGG